MTELEFPESCVEYGSRAWSLSDGCCSPCVIRRVNEAERELRNRHQHVWWWSTSGGAQCGEPSCRLTFTQAEIETVLNGLRKATP